MWLTITSQHGHEIAAKVADQFMHERIHDQRDQQRKRWRVSAPPSCLCHRDGRQLEEPLGRQELAELVNSTIRFQRYSA